MFVHEWKRPVGFHIYKNRPGPLDSGSSSAELTRHGYQLFEGELHELRARLAGREGKGAEQAVALRLAHDCYIRFGMTAQAARVAEAME